MAARVSNSDVVVLFPATYLYMEELALVLASQKPSSTEEPEALEKWEDIVFGMVEALSSNRTIPLDKERFLRLCDY